MLTVQDRSLFTCGFVVLMGLSPAESDISRYGRDKYFIDMRIYFFLLNNAFCS